MTIRKLITWIILICLLVMPFINWRLGAVIWLCAWIIYILQLFFGRIQKQPPDAGDNSS